MSALSDPTNVVFELVDETPGDGLTLDEAYAFLVGADTSVFGVPKITVAAGFNPNQLRGPDGKWVDTGHFPTGTQVYENKYGALTARTPGGDWHFYDKGLKVWNPSSPATVKHLDSRVESGEVTRVHTVEQSSSVTSPDKTPVPTTETSQSVTPGKTVTDVPGSEFKKLTHSSAVALQSQTGQWTSAQAKGLNRYTSDDYVDVNTALRDDSKLTATLRSKVKTLRSAMKPISQNVVVYRSASLASLGITSKDDLPGLVGQDFIDLGFGSTTINRFKAKKFPGTVKFEIELPKGTRGAYVADVSANPSEEELIVDAGTRYRVLSAHVDEGGFWQVKIRAVV